VTKSWTIPVRILLSRQRTNSVPEIDSFLSPEREEGASMSEFRSDLLVTDRRRSSRRRRTSDSRPDSSRKNTAGASGAESQLPEFQSAESSHSSTELTIEQRRQIIDRRRQDRRRQIDPTTCERDYSDGEIEFMRAMDDYKRKSGRPFPTWSEVLEVFTSLGYRKVADPSTLEWRTFGENMGSL
jgi:hypothetical protein